MRKFGFERGGDLENPSISDSNRWVSERGSARRGKAEVEKRTSQKSRERAAVTSSLCRVVRSQARPWAGRSGRTR